MKRIKINNGPKISGYLLRIENRTYSSYVFGEVIPDIINLQINSELALAIKQTTYP